MSKMDVAELSKALDDAIAEAVAKFIPEHKAYHGRLDGDEARKFASMAHDERVKYVTRIPIASLATRKGIPLTARTMWTATTMLGSSPKR